MKRLADEENVPPFVILNRSEGSLLHHILVAVEERSFTAVQDDKNYCPSKSESHAVDTYEDRD